MARRQWKAFIFGLAAAVLSVFPAAAQDKVSLVLDWVVNGTHAGYFVARERGFYRQAGLDVTISRGFGSGDTVKRVATGSADFGIADTAAIIAARANEDVPVRMIAMIYDRASLGVIYLRQSGIKTPKDLEGRTIARTASGASVTMFGPFLKANSVDRSRIHEVVVDGATYLPLLMSGRVDAVLEQGINMGKFQRAAEQQGKQALSMLYADFGLANYGNALIADVSTLQDKPDMVRRFVDATLHGIAYAIAHPDEAIAALRSANPEIEAEGAKDELLALKETDSTEDVRTHGLGYISRARMEATRNSVTQAMSLARSVPLDDLYTDQFLPKQAVPLSDK